MKYIILLILLPTSIIAQDFPSIKNDIERLACFDKDYHANISQPIDVTILKVIKYITESFKNPFEVKFRNEKTFNNINLLKGTVAICGEVKAKVNYRLLEYDNPKNSS